MIPVYSADQLPDADLFAEYRKTATTRMAPIEGPCVVMTREGDFELPAGWRGFLAIDTGGYPYPVEAAEHARTYEPANA